VSRGSSTYPQVQVPAPGALVPQRSHAAKPLRPAAGLCSALTTRLNTWLSIGLCLAFAPQVQAQTPDRADFIVDYCVSCHNPDDYSGRLDFWSVDLASAHGARELWENVLRKLQSGAMPPTGEAQPAAAERSALVQQLTQELDLLAAAAPHAGRAPLTRLNRSEYANAVRDLLGITVDVSTLLPPDNESYGFDNIADVLGVSPLLLEQYLSASARIASLAVGNTSTPPIARTYRVRPDFSQDTHIEGLPLGTRGGVLLQHNFPVAGEYRINAVLARNTADIMRGLEEPHEVDFLVDGVSQLRAPVGGTRDTQLLTENPDSTRSIIGERLQLTLQLDAGAHEVGVTFVERNLARMDSKLQPFVRTTVDPVDEVGLPHLDSLIITGPLSVSGPGNSISRARIFTCDPAAQGKAICATDILGRLAEQAYRRPVGDSDLAPLLRMFEAGSAEGSFDQGIEQGLRLILANPAFLFRAEPDPEHIAVGDSYALPDQQLASRLSFFLWSSLPDAELLQLAEAGKLQDREVLGQQVARMLSDDKAQALTDNFAGQWLLLRNLKASAPNPAQFPDFDDNLRQAFATETSLFFSSIIEEDRSVLDLIDADYTFVNERLAQHYGMKGVAGSRFRRVPVPEERRGLLGQGSVLTVNSYATRTSPVLRGKWILSNLLGTPPPPPPPDVPDLNATSDDGQQLSVREQMVRHRRDPACASCHTLMDPLGLALENFDAVGRWREFDSNGDRIDPTGQLADGTAIDGATSLRRALLQRSELFVTTFTEKLLTYALGRGLTYEDAATVRSIVRAARQDNYSFSAIAEGIVQSTPFRMKTRTAPATALSAAP